jgi:hypothetical protein
MKYELTRDEALVWLNERVGRSVYVSVDVEHGELSTCVIWGEGELSYWSSDPESEPAALRGWEAGERMGLYAVGAVRLDPTGFASVRITRGDDDDEIEFQVAPTVTLCIAEQTDAPAA